MRCAIVSEGTDVLKDKMIRTDVQVYVSPRRKHLAYYCQGFFSVRNVSNTLHMQLNNTQ